MDLRSYAKTNLLVTALGLGGSILGILLVVSGSSGAPPACSSFQAHKDSVDTFNIFVMIVGAGAIASGVLAFFSGISGAAGGCYSDSNSITASVVIVAIVIPLALLLVILGFGIGATIQGECAERVCDAATSRCNQIGCTDLGTGLQDCRSWCKNDYDYFCDLLPPYFSGAAIIFAMVSLFSIPSIICGCGAVWVCPEKFFTGDNDDDDEMWEDPSSSIVGRAEF